MRVLLALAAATALLLLGTGWRLAADSWRGGGCEMTYMYTEYEQVAINGSSRSDRRYKLYLYREAGGPSKQGGRGWGRGGVAVVLCCWVQAAAALH
jgi:hypothetical protein